MESKSGVIRKKLLKDMEWLYKWGHPSNFPIVQWQNIKNIKEENVNLLFVSLQLADNWSLTHN